MAIDLNIVKHTAHLARIDLAQNELELLSRQLKKIVDFIDKLREVDISNIEPTSHILPIDNVFRTDSVSPSLDVKDALKNTANQKDSFFVVPKIID